MFLAPLFVSRYNASASRTNQNPKKHATKISITDPSPGAPGASFGSSLKSSGGREKFCIISIIPDKLAIGGGGGG